MLMEIGDGDTQRLGLLTRCQFARRMRVVSGAVAAAGRMGLLGRTARYDGDIRGGPAASTAASAARGRGLAVSSVRAMGAMGGRVPMS